MIDKKALRYSVAWLLAMAVLAVALGFVSWRANSGFNGFDTHYCSILLQYCGLDARISIKEILYLWGGWGFLPTVALLWLFYRQAGQKSPKFWHFLLALLISVVLQSIIAFQLWGVRYFVDDFARSSSAQTEIPFLTFFAGFTIISIITVGIMASVLVLISSGLLKYRTKKG